MATRKKNCEMSHDMRLTIISMWRRRIRVSDIARMLGKPRSTISSIVHLWLKDSRTTTKKRAGRKRRLDSRALRRLRSLIMLNRFATRRYVYGTFKQQYGYNICFRTFLRYCRRIYAYRGPNLKKEVLTERHRKLRMAWCRVKKFWAPEMWNKVIFSDECCVKIGCDRRVYVWKLQDEGYYRPDLYGDNKTPKCKS